MAVLIEGYSVVVRNSTLAAKYPGGVEGYRRDCPNQIYCADENLSRIGFMVHRDAEVFVAQLAEKGLTPYRKGAAEDVALVCQEDGPLQECAWLELGQSGQSAIAWLAGTDRGKIHAPAGWDPEKQIQHLSAEEIKQRLEFVRTDGKVDVYRDKTTGKKLYVGRTAPTTATDKSRHDKLYQKGCSLIGDLIIVGNQQPGPLQKSQRQKLDDAIPLFEEAIQINPNNWAAMWLLGKIYQRLNDYENGLAWFARAHRIDPEQPDVAREASIAAMEVGRPEEAVPFCERAIEANTKDAGLRANLALALLFSGKPKEAQTVAEKALAEDPADEITANIVNIIKQVVDGARACPRHMRDLQQG